MTTEDTESAEDLLVKNMEYAAVIRSLRANAREERDQLKQLLAADSENVDAYLGVCIERDEAIAQAHNFEQGYHIHSARADEAIRERDELRELVKAYQDYTQLLGDEINDTAAVAYLHGWRSSRYEQGKVLREKIKQLEETK